MSERIYLVTGGTGTTGADLVRKLAAADPLGRIGVGTRDPSGDRATKLRRHGDNIEPVRFDIEEPSSLETALAGVTHLYLLPPFDPPRMVAWHERVMEAAAKVADLRLVVKHSVIGARPPAPGDEQSGIPRIHYAGEEVVMRCGAPWAVIRPTIFAQHLTTFPWIYEPGDDYFYLPIDTAGIAFLDARDIATLATFLLTRDDPDPYNGGVFTLTGPRAVTGPEIEAAFGRAAGRPIRWINCTDEVFQERIDRFRGPAGIANIYREARAGWFGHYLAPDFQRTLGFDTTSLERFALDHAARFRRVVRS